VVAAADLHLEIADMRPPPTPLHLDRLEDRDVPAGGPWPDGQNLTLSFAPDDTPIGAAKSALSRALKPLGADATWQREVLRAFQTWAVQTNLNIGLVVDGKQPFGTPGAVQGDYRFGDIRVGGEPLSADALAITAPFDWASGTWSGDVLFNTAVKFALNPPAGSSAYDLFTVALHEAGHALGLDHSPAAGSAMAPGYSGPLALLAATDVSSIQSLYGGSRQPDAYEGAAGNDTPATATALTGAGNLSVTADLTTAVDVDYYKFTAADKKFTVRVQTSGLSLLTARVTVLDAAGKVVGSAAATDPTKGDLEVKVENATPGAVYTVRVASNSADVFGIGRYQLGVDYRDQKLPPLTFAKDNGANNTAAGATALVPLTGSNGNPTGGLGFAGVLENKTDADFYRLTTPATADGPTAVVIRVVGLNPKGLAPTVAVFDAQMNPVAVQVVAADGAGLTVQVANARRNAVYLVRVTGNGTDATNGNYLLTADFTAALSADLPLLAAGTAAAGGPFAGTLTLSSAAVFRFDLGADAPAGAVVTLTVTDAKGKVVLSASPDAGGADTARSVYLPAGTYRVSVSVTAPKGPPGAAPAAGAEFWLSGGVVSDPAGPYKTTTGQSPLQTQGTTTTSGAGTTTGSGGKATTDTSGTTTTDQITSTTTGLSRYFTFTAQALGLPYVYPYGF
jgi:hypothetical protein